MPKKPSWIQEGKRKPKLKIRVLQIEIRAGETFCCSWWPDPEKRCPHLGTSYMGSRHHCMLFGKEFPPGQKMERLPECLAAEKRG